VNVEKPDDEWHIGVPEDNESTTSSS